VAAGSVVLIAAVGALVGNAVSMRSASTAPIAQPPADVLTAALDAPAPAPTRERVPSPPALWCPPEMVRIDGLCIDRYEAHLVQMVDGRETRHPYSSRPRRRVRYEARSDKGVKPQGYISHVEATRACRNAGKRLCKLDEWQRACQGASGRSYPYGDDEVAGHCNVGKGHLMGKLFGSDALAWSQHNFNSPKLNEEPRYLAKTGAYERCTTPEGVHDMVGNLHEWIDATVTPALMRKLKTEPVERHGQPWRSGNSIFMGGFFSTKNEHGPGCHFITVAHEARYHDYSTGFRCCAEAKAR
jgi:sulfatase modifying factor 1